MESGVKNTVDKEVAMESAEEKLANEEVALEMTSRPENIGSSEGETEQVVNSAATDDEVMSVCG
jgi:Tfp pilus assembly protein PilX